jgi:hypothetical protein
VEIKKNAVEVFTPFYFEIQFLSISKCKPTGAIHTVPFRNINLHKPAEMGIGSVQTIPRQPKSALEAFKPFRGQPKLVLEAIK